MHRLIRILLVFSLMAWSVAGVLPPGVARAEGQQATSIIGEPHSVQYSDQVTLTASLTSETGPVAGKVVEFRVNGMPAGSGVTDAAGVAMVFYNVNLPADTYWIDASFAGDETYQGSYDTDTLTVTHENATVVYIGDTVVSDHPLTLAAHVVEAVDGYSGDISGEMVQFTVCRLDGAVVATRSASVDPSGYAVVSSVFLPVDEYTVRVELLPSQRHNAALVTASIYPPYTETVITVPSLTVPVGQPAMLEAFLKDAAGAPMANQTVEFRVNGSSTGYAVTDGTGRAAVSYTAPGAGQYTVTAVYSGGRSYGASQGTGTLTVTQLQSVLVVPDSVGVYTDYVLLRATLTADGVPVAGKTVKFQVGGVVAGTGTTDATGLAEVGYIVNLPQGTYWIQALFAGDQTYQVSADTATLTVTRENATLAYAGSPTVVSDQPLTLAAHVVEDADGWLGDISGEMVQFTVCRLDGAVAATRSASVDPSGYAVVSSVFLPVDEYTVAVELLPSQRYHAMPATASIYPPYTQTALTVPSLAVSVGQPAMLEAFLKDAAGAPMANQTVEFRVNGSSTGYATTDVNGRTAVSYTAPGAGQYTVTAVYSGGPWSHPSQGTGTLTVERVATYLTATDTTVMYGQMATLQAALLADGVPVAGRPVTFTLAGQVAGVAITNASGVAHLTVTVSLPKGSYLVEARFDGDSMYLPDSTVAMLTVMPLQPALAVSDSVGQYSDSSALRATMTLDGAPVAGKTVTFTVDGVVAGTGTTDASGLATVSWTAALAAGTYQVEATFAGDPAYAAASEAGALTVTAEDATLAYTGETRSSKGTLLLQATLSQTADGQPGDYTRAGSVRFTLTKSSDGSPIAVYSAQVDANGRASLTVPAPSAPADVHAKVEPNGYFTANEVTVLKVR